MFVCAIHAHVSHHRQYHRAAARVSELEREMSSTRDQLTSSAQAQISELKTQITIASNENKSREQEAKLKDQHIASLEAQVGGSVL
jgi:chromosome segregation ATPase